MNTTIQLLGMTIDVSSVRSTFSSDGLPVWAGKVVLTFIDEIDGTTTAITANLSGVRLVDFEGEPEDGDPIYEACELHAVDWASAILSRIGRPSAWDAHQNDLRERGIIAA